MQYIAVILLALAITAAVSAHGWDRSSCSCDDECHHPQCCSDGKTYMSPCYVKCRNDYMKKAYGKTIQVIRHGNCGIDAELKPKIFRYCGKSDLAQSPAVEIFEVLEPMTVLAEVWDEGKCDCDRNDYRPQCASDWETYANPCFVDCRNEYLKRISGLPIYITYAGKCYDPIIPVVDIHDDGNDDVFDLSGHLSKNTGEDDGSYQPSDVEVYDESLCACDKDDNRPQCASDWQTYANPCFVDCRNEYLNRTSGLPIYITYTGKCYEPVIKVEATHYDENNDGCDHSQDLSESAGEDDGSYHPSADEYESENLKHETNIDVMTVILKTEVPTTEAPTTKAVEIYDESQCMCDKNDNRPQCASDWKTYLNPCFVDCRNDYLRRISGLPIYITYAGKCYEPVLPMAVSLDDENNNAPNRLELSIKNVGEDDGSYHPSADEYIREDWKDDTNNPINLVLLESEAPISNSGNLILLENEVPMSTVVEIWDDSTCLCDKNDNRPQCGSDWQTYANPCFVDCRNDYLRRISGLPIYITYAGKCYEPVIKVLPSHADENDDGYEPSEQWIIIPGEDDGSYHPSADECEHQNQKADTSDLVTPAILKTEASTTETPTTKAIEIYDESQCMCDKNDNRPLCASDWQTYANPCFVDCRNDYLRRISGLPIYITYAGKCYEPVLPIAVSLDDENNNAPNSLELSIKNVGEDDGSYHPSADEYIREDWKDDTNNPINLVLLESEAPISNYGNLILLENEVPMSTVVEIWDDSTCLCDKNDNRPQCGSDWQTYANPCFVDCRNDYLRRISGLPIYITYAGKCYEPVIKVLPSHADENDDGYEPSEQWIIIPGEDDGSYHPSADECEHQNQKADTSDLVTPAVLKTEASTTETPTTKAIEIYDESQCMCDKNDNRPQCASDWQTYANPCFVDCRNDYLRRISGLPIYITYAGKCYEPVLPMAVSLDDENNNAPNSLELSIKNVGEDDGSYHPSADEYIRENWKDDTNNPINLVLLESEAPISNSGNLILLENEVPMSTVVEIWDDSTCLCDKNDNRPQCGSDWQTYANPCFVDCRNDYLRRISGLPIYITYAGKCYEPVIKVLPSHADENDDGYEPSEQWIIIPGEDDGSYHPSADECEHQNQKDDTSDLVALATLKIEAPTTVTPRTKVIEVYDESQCLCDKNDIRPQCASDWKTYLNPCFVDCRNDYLRKISGMPIFITYAGKCYEPVIQVTANQDDRNVDHPKNLGKTAEYDDGYLLTALEIYDESRCLCDKYDVRPQCASDWQTYLNPCFVDCRNEYLKRISAMPIFITYAGKCYEPLIQVAAKHDEGCDHSEYIIKNADDVNYDVFGVEIYDESRCRCDKYDVRPQCASDWQTYLNPCFVDCRNEYLKRISAMPIFITYAGKCYEPLVKNDSCDH